MKNRRRILVIDGQGGGMGAQLVRQLAQRIKDEQELVCVGTNVIATSAMLKAGASQGATGENAVIYNAGRADVIVGPIGIILANGIMGEVSPAMAGAVSGAGAVKVLIPTVTCGVRIAGAEECRLEELIRRAVDSVLRELDEL